MTADDTEAVRAGLAANLDIDIELLDLDREQHRMHYDVVANGTLWFLHHGLFDRARRPRFDLRFRDAWEAFVAVNRRFADAAAERATAGDTVLVQDYQLGLVPGQLRALRPDLRVVHFTHTPFAGPDDFSLLPTDIGVALCRSLASRARGLPHEAVGRGLPPVGTGHARAGTRRSPHRSPRASAPTSPRWRRSRRRPRPAPPRPTSTTRSVTGSSSRGPTGSSPPRTSSAGSSRTTACSKRGPGCAAAWCSSRWCTRRARASPEYLAYANEVEQVVARVNDRWATRDWTPILLDDRDHFARSIAGMQRYDVLLVNTLRDGLNLVAKEGPAVNRRDGVLCLSPETGAYEELKPAVIAVHPYDLEQAAGALDEALSLPFDERATRAAKLRELATTRSPADWIADLVGHAAESTRAAPRARRRADPHSPRARAGPRRSARRSAARAATGRHPRPRSSSTNAGRSPRSSPTKAATSKPTTAARVASDLSTSMGGRSSIAIRVRSSARPSQRARPPPRRSRWRPPGRGSAASAA